MIPILIVLYNPGKSVLSRLCMRKNKSMYYIFDNSNHTNIQVLGDYNNYHYNGQNIGIAGAIEWMVSQCEKHELKNFLFFDQDTIYTERSLSDINRLWHELDDHNIIINYTSQHLEYGIVKYVINSGTIYPYDVLKRCIPIPKVYIIDALDLYICYNARKHGVIVKRQYVSGIDHYTEQGYNDVIMCGIKLTFKKYEISRRKIFRDAHLSLIAKSIKDLSILDTLIITKYLLAFIYDQFKTDIITLRLIK